MRALDASEPTTLLREVLDAWSLDSIGGLLQKANASAPPDFAQLFPAIETAGAAGDAIAQQILSAAGAELASLASVVIGRLWPEPQTVRVAIGGGVFKHSRLVRRSFWTRLRGERPGASISFRIIEPVAGALWMARRLGARIGDK
jgi:N-acetylglucosamine kinase-like BadF-type ATPase